MVFFSVLISAPLHTHTHTHMHMQGDITAALSVPFGPIVPSPKHTYLFLAAVPYP